MASNEIIIFIDIYIYFILYIQYTTHRYDSENLAHVSRENDTRRANTQICWATSVSKKCQSVGARRAKIELCENRFQSRSFIGAPRFENNTRIPRPKSVSYLCLYVCIFACIYYIYLYTYIYFIGIYENNFGKIRSPLLLFMLNWCGSGQLLG